MVTIFKFYGEKSITSGQWTEWRTLANGRAVDMSTESKTLLGYAPLPPGERKIGSRSIEEPGVRSARPGSIEGTRRERFSVNLPLARWRSQPHYCLNSEVDQHSPGVHGLYRGSIVPGDSLTHPHPHPSYKPTIELLVSSDTRRRCLHLGFVGPLASDSLTRCTRQLVSVSSYRWRNADDRYVIG